MEIQVDKRGAATSGPFYEDAEGFNMPLPPDSANRRIPLGDFPTGPELGTLLPNIVATDQAGELLDLHADRAGQPAVVVFYRSAVW
ncbi:MAG: hypothetical protein ACRBK7_23650 [Acidimicrobiales bacterium]